MRCKIESVSDFKAPFVLLTLREIDIGPRPSSPATSANTGEKKGNLAAVIRDSTNWLQNVKALREKDVIVLLTPVVIPISQDPTDVSKDVSDPFEPLGRSLAKRHARIRHVPYTQRWGKQTTSELLC